MTFPLRPQKPDLRRGSIRRNTQKIRPSMLPLAALTVKGSATSHSLSEVCVIHHLTHS